MIKEKLKLIKKELKMWNKDVHMDGKIEKLKEEIYKLDLFDDNFGIEEEETIQSKVLSMELLRCLNQRNNLYAQKAIIH